MVAPEGTVTDEFRRDRYLLLLDREIVTPPAGAGLFKVNVQVALDPDGKVVGLHVKDESVIDDARLIVAVFETPLREAVSVAL